MGLMCSFIYCSAMNDSIEELPEEILFSMLKFFEGQEKLQPFNSLAAVPSEEVLKICHFFEETLSFWVKLLSQITGNHNQSVTSVTGSNLGVLWAVLCCYPHFQRLLDSVSPVVDLIVSLDQFLETEAGMGDTSLYDKNNFGISLMEITNFNCSSDNIAGIPKSTWLSLLGTALISYHKLLLVRKTGHSETSTFLRLAKRHKSSPQVLFAVAEFLDSIFGYNALHNACDILFGSCFCQFHLF